MGHEMMDLDQLASYLRRDVREVGKLANRGHLPGQKVAGQWRFAQAEIHHWLETQLHSYSCAELSQIEKLGYRLDTAHSLSHPTAVLGSTLTEASISVTLRASTKASVLRELVALAEQTWHVYDPTALLEAIRTREELASTALPGGLAMPHARRALPAHVLGDSVVAFGKTSTGIPFGADRGELTDLFFLICAKDDQTHLRLLARIARLCKLPSFLENLRLSSTPDEVLQIIAEGEADLLSSQPEA